VIILNDEAQIAGQPLVKEKYWEITKEEHANPEFYALLFLFRRSDT
jgi:hypothetical protein